MSLVDIVGNTETVNLLWDSVITAQWSRFYEKKLLMFTGTFLLKFSVFMIRILYFFEKDKCKKSPEPGRSDTSGK